MLNGSPAPSSKPSFKPSMLCVCSKANDEQLDLVLRNFNATVVHDARVACRKASLGSYDIYFAYDPRSVKSAAYLWENVRAFDRNTPFVMVCGESFPDESGLRIRHEFDRVVHYPCSVGELLDHIRSMLAIAERRGLAARAEEARAIAMDLTTRLSELEERVSLSRQSLARAQEHVMRAYALRAFEASGGTRACFDRYWPETFDEMLRASYPGGVVEQRRE